MTLLIVVAFSFNFPMLLVQLALQQWCTCAPGNRLSSRNGIKERSLKLSSNKAFFLPFSSFLHANVKSQVSFQMKYNVVINANYPRKKGDDEKRDKNSSQSLDKNRGKLTDWQKVDINRWCTILGIHLPWGIYTFFPIWKTPPFEHICPKGAPSRQMSNTYRLGWVEKRKECSFGPNCFAPSNRGNRNPNRLWVCNAARNASRWQSRLHGKPESN